MIPTKVRRMITERNSINLHVTYRVTYRVAYTYQLHMNKGTDATLD